MADIFLSYTEKDRAAARRLADMLQSVGWSVWWDRRIPAGLTWREVLEAELQTMRCMIVLWSAGSVQSDWVCEEAAEGRQRDRLVPVLIDRVKPPVGFREIQAADLVDWNGARDAPGFQQLIDDLARLIGKPAARPQAAAAAGAGIDAEPAAGRVGTGSVGGAGERASRPSFWMRLAWAGAAVVVLAGGAFLAFRSPAPSSSTAPAGADPLRAAAGPRTPPPLAAAKDVGLAAAPTVAASPAAGAAPAQAWPHLPRASAAQAVPHPVESGTLTQRPASGVRIGRDPATRPAVVHAASERARCAALLDRMRLGEALSAAAGDFYRQECRR